MEKKPILLECAGCGAPLDSALVENGVCRCKYCAYNNVMPRDEQTEEVLLLLHDGEAELRNSSFERAYNAFKRASELDPEESRAYFGMALAANRVKYIKDIVNKRYQPICFEVTDRQFDSDKNFSLALEYATTDEQYREYEARARDIDYIREKFFELKSSGLSYDTFICVKVSDGEGGYTTDSVLAGKLYDSIKRAGAKPFYSEREIGDRVGEDYEALILYALYTSKSFIIVCSNEDYLRTPWVQNEYTRYYAMLTDKEKAANSIMIAFNGEVIERIPGIRGKIQGVDLKNFEASQRVCEFVKKFSSPAPIEAPKPQPVQSSVSVSTVSVAQKYCRSCGTANPEEAVFCASCGGKEFAPKNEKICIECESINVITAKFCLKCGGEKFASDAEELERIKEERRKAEEERLRREARIARLKKLRPFIIAASIVLVVGIAVSIAVGTTVKNKNLEKAGGFDLVLSDDEQYYIVDGINEKYQDEKEFVIPDTYKNKPVKEITANAFKGNKTITSVIIPDSVISIGSSAFENCTGITSVVIPDSVISFGFATFGGCTSLESITIPFVGSSKTKAEKDHFAYIFGASEYLDGLQSVPTSLKSVTISSGETSVRNYAFYGCESLTSITIPNSVTSIGDYAFRGCTGLTSVTIPDSVTSIGNYAFSGCNRLTSVTIPDSVTSIGNRAFFNCTGLTSATIGDSVTSIGNSAFRGCTGLTSVTIPDSVTSIGEYAFYACDNLTSAIIGDNITSIGECAFYGCDSLTSVTIPDSVTNIGRSAFYDCDSITSVTIPDSVTSIGEYAFYGCDSLTSVTIGNGVTSIGHGVFSNCTNLKSVKFENPNGWWHSDSAEATSGTSINGLDDTSMAAKYLSYTYADYYWMRG